MLNIFKIKIDRNISYKLYQIKSNLASSIILGICGLITNTLVLILSYNNFITLNTHTRGLTYLLISWLILWFMALIFLKCYRKNDSIFISQLLVCLFIYPTFYISTSLHIIPSNMFTTFSKYTVFILTFCLLFSLSMKQTIIVFIPTIIISFINLLYIFSEQGILYNNLSDIFIMNLISFTYSIIKSHSAKKKFDQHILLLDTIAARDNANIKLQLHEKYVTDFFVNISHDIKTPINIIYSCEQLLEKQIYNQEIDFPKAEKYITSIKLNSFRLTRLLNNVLDISKIDAARYSLNLRNLDIITTIEGIVDSLTDFMNSKGIDLIFDTDFEEKILALDEEKLERILLNLLSNALKFTPTNGKIIIFISENEDQVFVSIEDTGIGIDEKTQINIFDRYVQGSISPANELSGSGIGLSLVKSLMVLHGGDVTLESKVGEGSKFTLLFPKRTIEKTLDEDIANGNIYPNNDIASSTQLEFAGLVKEIFTTNTNM